MLDLLRLSRRTFVSRASGLAAAAAAGLTGLFRAAPASSSGLSAGNGSMIWETAAASEFEQMIGHGFRLGLDDGTWLGIKLVGVKPVRSGSHRPANLPRREGVVLVFDGAQTERLVASGGRSHPIRHARLGAFDLFVSAVPRRSGGHSIEAVLN